MLKTSLLFID